MKQAHKWTLIFLSFTLLMLTNISHDCVFNNVFGALSRISADYVHRLKFANDTRSEPVKNTPATTVTIIKGINGSEVFINIQDGITIQDCVSGEYLDFSAYIRHIILWEIMKHAFQNLWDSNKQMIKTVGVFCLLLGLLPVKKGMKFCKRMSFLRIQPFSF